MKRRALFTLIATLPLVARIRPATPSKSPGRPSMELSIYDRALTRETVAVFTLDGTTYGIRMTKEFIDDVTKGSVQSIETILSRFLYTVTDGDITNGADVSIRYRSGQIPPYQIAQIAFITEYVQPRNLNTIPPGATIVAIQTPFTPKPEVDDAVVVYRLGRTELFSYTKVQIVTGNHNVTLLV